MTLTTLFLLILKVNCKIFNHFTISVTTKSLLHLRKHWGSVSLHIISINSSEIHLLNNFGGSLESPYWLLLAFCPEILGGGGDLRMILLLFYGCHLSAENNQRLWGHSNPIYC